MDFRDLIFRNGRRKFFSLLLAILIWTTIHFADQKHRAERAAVPSPQTNEFIP